MLISHGGTEMGQGLHTKVAQVAAEELGVPLSMIECREADTSKVPNAVQTAASCGSDLNGAAVADACKRLFAQGFGAVLQRHRGGQLRLPPGASDEQRRATFAAAAAETWFKQMPLSATGYYKTPIAGCNWTQQGVNEFVGEPFQYYAYGIACCEVEVDCLTGDHSVLRADLVHDVGKSLNPALDIGQVEGAFIQGLGLFTLEELVYSPGGTCFTKGPGLYKIPSIGDVPLDFRVGLLEGSVGPAVKGSKAVGEPPFFLGSSVFFALKNAIESARRDHAAETGASLGYFRLDSPATAERIRLGCLDFLHPKDCAGHWHKRA